MIAAPAGSLMLSYGTVTALLLVPGVAVLLLLRSLIRRNVAPLPASIDRLWAAKFARGVVLGLCMVVVTVLPPLVLGAYSPGNPGWQGFAPSWGGGPEPGVWGLAALVMVLAAYEELLFRALYMGLFGVLLLWLGSMLMKRPGGAGELALRWRTWLALGAAASAVTAAAFALYHRHNPAVSDLALVNIALAGLVLGLVAWIDGDIWGAWGLHVAWNLSIALCGLPVSGLRIHGLAFPAGAVPGLLTGGQFGPEASLPATVAMAAAVVAVLWLCVRERPVKAAEETDVPLPETQSQD